MLTELADFHLLRPWWLLALPLVVALAIYWQRRVRRRTSWSVSIERDLLDVLLDPAETGGKRWLTWPLLAVPALLVLALSGPTFERLPQPVSEQEDALVIALDLSLSMYAQDVRPSRLVRAKQEIIDILRTRSEGTTALVAYSGTSHAVAPLTDDVRTIENLLNALEPAMMPVQGSDPRAGLTTARALMDNAHAQRGRILLVTDGVDRINDVTEFRDPAFPISILGIGTPGGASIPLDFVNQPGRFLTTRDGETIIARLDDERLQNIADLTYGRYTRLRLDDGDTQVLLATQLPGDDATREVDRQFDLWHDLGYWLALAALPLFLFGFRRGLVASVCAVVGLPLLLASPQQAHANFWDDLWQRPDQQGYDALRLGSPEHAVAMFEDPRWAAVARYRSGDYPGAVAGFEAQDDITGTYNLGNALAKSGQLEQAIERYDEVLQADPTHEDAAFNKALVEKLLEEQAEGSQQDNQEQQQESQNSSDSQREDQQEDQSEQSQDQQDQGQEDEQDGEQQQQEADPSDGEQSEQEQEQMASERDESEEALEQWLRRVPDDPGGLLRRKFQYENQQRLRRGDYSHRRSEKIW